MFLLSLFSSLDIPRSLRSPPRFPTDQKKITGSSYLVGQVGLQEKKNLHGKSWLEEGKSNTTTYQNKTFIIFYHVDS